MAKTAQGVPFTAAETKQAQEAIKSLGNVLRTAAEKWAILRSLARNGAEVDKVRKQQLAEWYRAAWIERAKKQAGDAWTDEMLDATKRTANADFSRGMRDPAAKPKPKGPQTAQNKPTSDAAAKDGDTLAETQQRSATGDFARQQAAKDILVRVKSVQAEMLQFQTNVRIPKQGQALIGDIAEQMAKLHEQASALVAAFE